MGLFCSEQINLYIQKMSRSSNFTQQQIEFFLDVLEACPELISGKLGAKIPSKHHLRLAWEALAQKVNELGSGSLKSGDQYRAKWHDMKYRARQKAAKVWYLKTKETCEELTPDEILTPSEKRLLEMIGWKDCDPVTSSNFDSTAVSLKRSQQVNILDFVTENSENTDNPDTSENNATDCNAVTIKVEDNTSNEASSFDWPKKVVIQDVRGKYSEENASVTENDSVNQEKSNDNWPYAANQQNSVNQEKSNDKWSYAANQQNNSTKRSIAFRARKRKRIDDEEDSFEKKAIATQERMAADINEIKISMIEMKSNMKKYMERIDQKFDKMLDLLAVALNVDPDELNKK